MAKEGLQVAQQNLKQPWTPLRRFQQAVKQGFSSKTEVVQSDPEEDNPWFRLARESSWSPEESNSSSDTAQSNDASEHVSSRGKARWLSEGGSPYGFSDEDGTLKQLDSSNWRRLMSANRNQRFVPVNSRWQEPPSSNTESSIEKTGSTWLLQSVFAIGLVALGLYASNTHTALAAKVDSAYKTVFAQDYSSAVIPTISNFLSAHHISVPAWVQAGAIHLHVPMSGSIITDYSSQHPEMVIQGTPKEAVLATGSGVVAKAEQLLTGSLVVVDHGKLGVSIYDGLGTLAVHQGEYVSSGQVLGHLPSKGHPDLRFSIEQNGHYVNPHDYIVFPASTA